MAVAWLALPLRGAPTISSQPAHASLIAGQNTLLNVAAAGTGTLSYQWKRNGFPISGATSPALAIGNCSARDNGYYRVDVTDTTGTTTSAVAFVTVAYASAHVFAWGSNDLGESTIPPGLTNVVAVAAGRSHGVALKGNGTVAQWGSYEVRSVPSDLTDVVAIAAGGWDNVALKRDGTVVGWGFSFVGSPPAGLANVVAVAVGGYHALALKSDGTVVAWGQNDYGQTSVPAGLSNVVAVSGGSYHSVALKADGTVVAWGYSFFGQTAVPTGLNNVIAVSGGGPHNLALRADGTVASWGSDAGATLPSGLSSVVAIAAGGTSGYALKSDGTVAAWGHDAEQGAIVTPVGLNRVVAIAARTDHAYALRDGSGEIAPTISTQPASLTAKAGDTITFIVTASSTAPLSYQWSKGGTPIAGATSSSLTIAEAVGAYAGTYTVAVTNHVGTVVSTPATLSLTPNFPVVTAQSSARQVVTAGHSLTLSVTATNSPTYQWKRNGRPISGATSATYTINPAGAIHPGYYQAVVTNANGTTKSAIIFVNVVANPAKIIGWGNNGSGRTTAPGGLASVATLEAGYDWSAALKGDGTVAVWGGTVAGTTTVPSGLTSVVGLAAGGFNLLALKSDGTVVGWGNDNSISNIPAGLANVVEIAGGGSHVLALRSDGTVIAWGGGNDSRERSVPPGLMGVTSVAAASAHSLALKSDGTVVAWGSNSYGESSVPAALTNVVAIAAAAQTSVALKSDGTVVAWGRQTAPVPSGLAGVIRIWGKSDHFIALKGDGTIVAWGGNGSGESSPPNSLSQVIAGAAGLSHSLALRDASGDVAPQFTSANATLFPVGVSSAFTVTATGVPTPVFRVSSGSLPAWASLDAVTGVISGIPPSAAGAPYTFTLTASNGVSPDATQTFSLNVNASPVIQSISPQRQVATLGQPLTLSVNATGTPSLAVQWRRNGRPIPGATATTLTRASAAPGDAGWYQVVLTDSVGTTTSPVMFVNVAPAVSKLVHWGDATRGQATFPSPLGNITSIVAGPYHTTALRSDGTVVAWGQNGGGGSSYPPPDGLDNVVAIAEGGSDSMLALKSDGTVVGWGTISGTMPTDLRNIVAIAEGYSHALVLRVDGIVRAWGINSEGEATVPAGLANVIGIAAGNRFSLALKADGTVVAWGLNDSGQCSVPAGLSNVTRIAAGYAHAVATKADGTVVAWGINTSGQGTVPVQATSVSDISTLWSHNLALRSDRTVFAWGLNANGQTAVPSNLSNVTAVAAGLTFSLALREGAADAAPTFSSAATATFIAGSAGSFTVTANATPAAALTLTSGTLPPWLSFNSTSGVLSGTPPIGTATTLALGFTASNGVTPAANQNFSLLVGAAPTLASGPASATRDAGDTFTFSATTGGTGPFTYQWQRQAAGTSGFADVTGANYAGATSATLTVSNSTLAMHGDQFRVIVSSPFGSVTSASSTLSIRGAGSVGQMFVAVGENGSIVTSPDAVTWTPRSSATTKRLRAATTSANQIVVVGETGTILTSSDGVTWTARASGTNQTLRGVASGPSLTVAVGGAATSLVLRSADGVTWSNVSVPALGTLRSVAWGSSQWVAVGRDGTILTSADGLTWAPRAAGTSERLDGVVWTGSQFIIIGETGRLLTSADAVTWTASSSTPPSWIEAMTWNSSRLVAVGANGRIATSTDGASWSTLPSGTLNRLHGVAWSGTASSPVGNPVSTLDALRLAPEILTQPASALAGAGGAVSFAVSASGAGTLTYQWRFNGTPLTDGAKYTGANSARLTIANLSGSDIGSYSVAVTGTAGTTVSNPAALTLRGLGTTGLQFVAVGEGGAILTSPDGLGWTARTSGTLKRLRAATSTTSQFIVVGETGTILTSADGLAWAARNSGTTETLRGVSAGAGLVIAVGGGTTARILTSTDGVSWSPATVPVAGSLRGVATGNGLHVAVGQNGTLLTSPDGLTWTSRSSGTSDRLDGVIWTGSQFIITGQSGLLLTSTDATAWTASFAVAPSWLEALAWNSARYVVAGANGRVATSSDGAAWSITAIGFTGTIHGLTWSGGSFIPSGNPVLLLGNLQQAPEISVPPASTLGGIGGTVSLTVNATGSGPLTYQWRFNGTPISDGAKYAGTNTATLTISNLGPGEAGAYSVVVTGSRGTMTSGDAMVSLRGSGSVGQQFIAVGENGTILTSPDGLAWTERTSGTTKRLRAATATSTQLITVGETGTILTSPEGVTWTPRVSGTTETLRGVAAGPNGIVAVGGAAAARIITSTDGITWSAATVPTAGSLRGIARGTTLFVAVGKDGAVLTSPSGATWTKRSVGTTERLDGVIWTGAQFVVIGESGLLLTSADGLTWNSELSSPPAWLEGMTWNTARYVVVGANGQIATSPDGSVWTTVPSGTRYTLHGVAWSGGSFIPSGNPVQLLGRLQQAPSILTQPAPLFAGPGGVASFSVKASGSGTLTYQWRFNGEPLVNGLKYAGATSATLTISGISPADGGNYSVVVTGSAGSAISQDAALVLRGVGATGHQFVAVGENGSLLTSPDGIGWTRRSSPTTRRLRSVTATATQFVTVGEAGTILASNDGATWTARNSGTSETLRGIVALPGLLVAVGGANSARIVTSNDGVTWASATTPNAGALRGIASGHGVFVAVGRNGTLLTSENGRVWTSRNAGTTARLDGVIWTGSQFIVITEAGRIHTSPDGTNWTAGASSTPPSWLEGITWDESRYIVVGGGGRILVSSGGAAWQPVTSGTSATLHGVTWSGGAFQPTGNPLALLSDLQLLPQITAQPVAVAAPSGGAASLSVSATGSGLSYQWFKQGVAIAGANSSTLNLTGLGGRDSGSYTVRVSNATGSTLSAPARLAVAANYTFSTLAGLAGSTGSVNATGSAARFISPQSVVADNAGSLLVADMLGGAVRKVTVPDGVVTTYVGGLLQPRGITLDNAGNAYVLEFLGTATRVRKIQPTASGPVMTVAAGGGGELNAALGLAAPPSGGLLIADTYNHIIQTVLSNGTIVVLAGFPALPGSTDSTGILARFNQPAAIASAASGNHYVADWVNHAIRRIDPTAAVTTLAGLASASGGTDGSGAAARFSAPKGVAVDASENLFVADAGNHTLRWVTVDGGVVTIGGLADTSGSLDGVGTAARFNQPNGIAVAASGDIFVADTGNATVRRGVPSFVATTIATQPRDQVVAVGELVSFSVVANGSGPFTYQWMARGAPIAGATNSTYSIERTQTTDAGTYVVVVTGAGGAVASSPVTLSVRPLVPTFAIHPLSQTTSAGQSVTLSALATGSPTPNYQWRRNGIPLPGQNGTTLGLVNVSTADTGSYDVVATNIAGTTVSSPATLTVNAVVIPPFVPPSGGVPTPPPAVNVAPVFSTHPTAQIALLGQNITLTSAASGTPAPTYQWQLNGANIPGATGASLTLSNIAANNAGTYRVVATNAAGSATSSEAVLTVAAPPVITSHPASLVLDPGDAATFTVSATGLPAPQFQWRKNGSPLTSATGTTLTLPSVFADAVATYDVVVTNLAGSVTSSGASLTLRGPPVIVTQPQAQIVALGGTTQLHVVATGTPEPTYQWRRNGTPISGANSSTLSLSNVTEAGSYDVVVTNIRGSVQSTLVSVTVTTTGAAPVFTLHPTSQTAIAGSSVTLVAAATGVPTPVLQWSKNGAPLPGATQASLTLENLQPSDGGTYEVTAVNTAGRATSRAASLQVLQRSFAGVYFGTFEPGLGTFALYIRSDNTGVLLGYLNGAGTPYLHLDVVVDENGRFSLLVPGAAALFADGGELGARPEAGNDLTLGGTISATGSLSASISGLAGASMSGTRSPDAGPTQRFSGFYSAGAATQSSTAYTIVSASGQAFVVTQTPAANGAGQGTIDNAGNITVSTSPQQTVTGSISPTTSTLTANLNTAGAAPVALAGASESILATQRLVNLSSRARAGSGDNVAIAGFVIKGQQSRPLLIRAIGPSLAAFGVTDAIPAPRLEIYQNSRLVASNSGWSSGTNVDEIQAATARAGGFPLARGSADAVILTTLEAGSYSALLRSATEVSGVGLIEVYDLSAVGAGERLANLSTRAFAGTGDSTLIAGVVVNGVVPKRILVRAVGPGLAQFGVSGVLPRPKLLLQRGSQLVAENTGWSTSSDADAIAVASRQIGAFPLAAGSADAALLLYLEPGAYSAQVLGADGRSGVALVEIYEIP